MQRFDEPRYDHSAQTKILNLAAELQEGHSKGMTAAEIEAVAATAGIEARFVHEALARLKESSVRSVPSESASISDAFATLINAGPLVVWLSLLLFLQVRSMYDFIAANNTFAQPLSILIAAVLGGTLTQVKKGGLIGFALIVGSSLSALCIVSFLTAITRGSSTYHPMNQVFRDVVTLNLLELAAMFLIFGLIRSVSGFFARLQREVGR